MKKSSLGDIPILAFAASSYLDWFWFIDHKDDDGAEAAYEAYQFYRQQLKAQMLQDMPHASELEAHTYVTGMIDGFIEAIQSEGKGL